MKRYIKYLVESFFDDDYVDEIEPEVSKELDKNNEDVLFSNVYKTFMISTGINIEDIYLAYGAKNFGQLKLVLKNIPPKSLYDPNYVLHLDIIEVILDNNLEFGLKILNALYHMLPCKIHIELLKFLCSPKDFNLQSDKVSYDIISYYSMHFKDMHNIPNNTEGLLFGGCLIDTFDNLNVDHEMSILFSNSGLPLDWKNFPTKVKYYFDIVFSIEGTSLKDTEFYFKSFFRSLVNFPTHIDIIQHELFDTPDTKKHIMVIGKKWTTELKRLYRKFIKDLCERDVPRKDRSLIYKNLTQM